MINTQQALEEMARFGNEERRLVIDAMAERFKVLLVADGEYVNLTGVLSIENLPMAIAHIVIEIRIAESKPTVPHYLLHSYILQQWAHANCVEKLGEWESVENGKSSFWPWLERVYPKTFNEFYDWLNETWLGNSND